MKARTMAAVACALIFGSALIACSGYENVAENESVSKAGGGSSSEFDEDDGDASSSDVGASVIQLKNDSIAFEGSGATIMGSVITVSAAGTYSVSGTLDNGQIVINVTDDGTVKLLLDGASISCSTSSPIYVVDAGKAVITLAEGSRNYVTDGSAYASADEPNAAVFSKSDLTINGSGALTVDANYANGIVSKDGLKIAQAAIVVDAVNDGIRGRDYIAVKSGTIAVKAGGDGLQSNNDEDGDAGFIEIADGSFDIVAGAKGIKAATKIAIAGGNFAIGSADDAIHSDGSAAISGGSFSIAAGGQGIKFGASSAMTIDGGTIDITKSTEGIAGFSLNINGGTIRIVASDDGFSMSASAVAGGIESNDGSSLSIAGGYIVVHSIHDGVDSNGSATMTGGTLIVHGPVSSPEAATDVNGTFCVNGGLLVAVSNYNNMVATPSASSTQRTILVKLGSSQAAASLFHVQDSSGNEVFTFKPAKSYQAVIFSSPALAAGTYSYCYGGTTTALATDGLCSGGSYTAGTLGASFTISSSITTVGATTTGGGSGGGTPPSRP